MLRRLLMIGGGVMATAAAAVFVWSKRRAELDAEAARATGKGGRGRRGARLGGRGGAAAGARDGEAGRDVGLTPLPPERRGAPAAATGADSFDRPGEAAAGVPGAAGGDDLRTVKGIGRVSAERLRAMGIVTFAQIATWSDDDLDAIAVDVGISAERIRREDWVGQARAIVEGIA